MTTPIPMVCIQWPPRRPRQGRRSGYSLPHRLNGTWRMFCNPDCSWAYRTPSMATQPATIALQGCHGLLERMASNITGIVNGDGTATIYAVTSTVSGNGDQGADPNKVVVITDQWNATSLPRNESFTTFRAAGFAEVLRGVSFAPRRGGTRWQKSSNIHAVFYARAIGGFSAKRKPGTAAESSITAVPEIVVARRRDASASLTNCRGSRFAVICRSSARLAMQN